MGGMSSCRGRAPGLGPPGKAMTLRHGIEGPDPRETGWSAPGPVWGETAPGLRGRETLATGDKSTLPIVSVIVSVRRVDR